MRLSAPLSTYINIINISHLTHMYRININGTPRVPCLFASPIRHPVFKLKLKYNLSPYICYRERPDIL